MKRNRDTETKTKRSTEDEEREAERREKWKNRKVKDRQVQSEKALWIVDTDFITNKYIITKATAAPVHSVISIFSFQHPC